MKNIFYAQSGGVTAVINATACGLIETARALGPQVGKVFAGRNGILGALQEELIDTSLESEEAIRSLLYLPGGAFGSCRYKLKSPDQEMAEYERLIAVFKAHEIGYFFYNGGNDSQDTTLKIAQISKKLGYPLVCLGIPKTIDNDLPHTDTCPGFGSAAKYISTSMREGMLDVASMAASSTKVFIMEVMGRHRGWLAAASGLASEEKNPLPHLILFPEIPFNEALFLEKVHQYITDFGYCGITVSEGLRNPQGDFFVESSKIDVFGHHQLGGTAPVLASVITRNLSYRCHFAVCSYLQRSGRHLASQTDLDQAYALGQKTLEFALQGKQDAMLSIERLSSEPYQWTISTVPLVEVANIEKGVPRDFISQDGYQISSKCRDYLLPLIQGEAYPPYEKGLPRYHSSLQLKLVSKKLETYR